MALCYRILMITPASTGEPTRERDDVQRSSGQPPEATRGHRPAGPGRRPTPFLLCSAAGDGMPFSIDRVVPWGRDLDFHVAALREMLRVAVEVRVFPLLQLGGAPSPHVAGVRAALAAPGVRVTVEPVPYEFQRDGNRMLRLRRGDTAGCA